MIVDNASLKRSIINPLYTYQDLYIFNEI